MKDTDITLPETNTAPENQWLEDEFPFGKAYFEGYVSFREGMRIWQLSLYHFLMISPDVSMMNIKSPEGDGSLANSTYIN